MSKTSFRQLRAQLLQFLPPAATHPPPVRIHPLLLLPLAVPVPLPALRFRNDNILKRLLFHAIGFNLALLVRKQFGIGKPRTLQGCSDVCLLVQIAWAALYAAWTDPTGLHSAGLEPCLTPSDATVNGAFLPSATGC